MKYTDTPIPPSHAPIHGYTDTVESRERSAWDISSTPIQECVSAYQLGWRVGGDGGRRLASVAA